MEDRYDIRFNRTEPSREDIAAHQDFDALLANFEQEDAKEKTAIVVPMRSKRRPYLAVAAAIALLLAAYPAYRALVQPAVADEVSYFAARPYLDPPATANVPDLVAEVVVDPETAQKIPLDNGQLILSATSFMTDRGKSIRKPVQVHYRQLDEVTDYFMAGLPLQYAQEGEIAQLDAAVVLDVHATAAGQLLPIADGQVVEVELNTFITNDGADYVVYQLDTLNRRWVEAGPLQDRQVAAPAWPEDLPAVQRYQQVAADFDTRIASAQRAGSSTQQLSRPTPPQREATSNPTLELDWLNRISLESGSTVSATDLKDINKGGIWELLPETGNVDLNAFNVEWSSVRLRNLPNDKYELTLINPQKEERLIVRPIMLDDGDFLEAQQRYEAELANYEAAMAASSNQSDDVVAQLKAEKANALSNIEQEILTNVAAMPLAQQQLLQRRNANFKFAISSWGIYAVARRIQDLPQLSQVSFQEQQALGDRQNARVYYTDGEHKTIYRGLVRKEQSKLPLAKDVAPTARIWIVNEQGELVLTELNQSSLPAADGSIRLKTNRAGSLPNSAALLRQKLVLE